MDPITEAAVEEALELLKAGKKEEARNILVPLARKQPDVPDVWYLLGFTVTDLNQKLYCFQQVLRIDPSNQAAQKQLAKVISQSNLPEREVHHSPQPVSNLAEKKQPKNNRRLIVLSALLITVIVAMFGGIAVYIFNGINMNNQINDLFAQHQCAKVVQYNSFDELFPKNMFSSSFNAYQQIEECQTQLALADAIKLQDWPNAYGMVENYLAQYPQGTFIKEVNEYAGNILLSWSKSLLNKNEYEEAVKKLELIQLKFSSSSANSTVMQSILDDYLLWGQYSFAQKDYESAEKNLKIVAGDVRAPLLQVKQANDQLVQVYLAWGKTQVESGQYVKGIEYYENAKALNPTLMNYDQLEAQAFLLQSTALRGAGDFDQALALVNGLLGKVVSDENKTDALAEQEKIFQAYSHSNSSQAQAQMAAMATNLCKDQLPTLPIFGTNADVVRFMVDPAFSIPLPGGMIAATPAELHNVVCVKQSSVTIETCNYQMGYVAHRNYYVWDVALYDIATGKPTQTANFKGSMPRSCGDTEAFAEDTKIRDIYGDLPKTQEIVDWLTGLNIAR